MNNRYYVYGIFINDIPIYIGKGSGDRLYHHQRELDKWMSLTEDERYEIRYSSRNRKYNYHKLNLMKNAIDKHHNIEYRILYDNLNERISLIYEMILISFYGRCDRKEGSLTNLTDGGEGVSGYIYTEEERENRRNRRLGKKLSTETIDKIRFIHIGRKRSSETCHKISLKAKERVGIKNPRFSGFYITPFGKFVTIMEASLATGISKNNIRKRCKEGGVITKSIVVSPDSGLTLEDIGKTWSDIGWGFEVV